MNLTQLIDTIKNAIMVLSAVRHVMAGRFRG
jgi:hypothetical protein